MSGEQIAAILIMGIVFIPVLIMDIVLLTGHGADLVAGYNTASPSEKAKWNTKAMCRAVGVLLLVIILCTALMVLGAVLDRTSLIWGGGILCAAATVGGIFYLNTSSRFKRK